jgi:leader peptidase (prepilin peptidase)/N-methyltransferase
MEIFNGISKGLLEIFTIVGIFLAGFCGGSFLHSAIDRFIRGSYSYIAYLKPCSFKRFPLVETLFALAFVISYLKFGFSLDFVFISLFIVLLVSASVIDWYLKIVPNKINLIGTISGLVYAGVKGLAMGSFEPLVNSIVGGLVGGGVLLTVAVAYLVIRKVEGIGMGDVKLLAFIGSYIGWAGALFTISLSFAVAFLISRLLLKSHLKKPVYIAFAPILATASIVYLLFFS